MSNPFTNVHSTKVVRPQQVSGDIIKTRVGRPKKPGVKKYSISLPITLREQLGKIAKGRGLDFSALLTIMGYHLLKNKDDILGV